MGDAHVVQTAVPRNVGCIKEGVHLTYRVERDEEDGQFWAECVELDVAGEGESEDAAVRSLRELLLERLFRPDAVAPPAMTPVESLELTRAGT
jgi:hypothetical protein